MKLEELVENFRDEARIDFISAWSIALEVSYVIESVDWRDVMPKSLAVIKELMSHDIFPGNYTLESLQREGFSFWPGTPEQLVRRIEDAWTALNQMPDVDDICWFALKPN